MSADRRLKLTVEDGDTNRLHCEQLTDPAVMSVQTSRGKSVHLDQADARALVEFLTEWLRAQSANDDPRSDVGS